MKKTANSNTSGFQKLLALAALVILYIFFAIFGRNFFSTAAMTNILESAYATAFMAIGVTFVIVTGGIDLSLGTVMMCSALVGGVAFNSWGAPLWVGLLLVVIVGTTFGLINGILVALLKLPPFIATMGTMLVAQGLGAIITKVQTQRYPTVGTADGWFKSVFFKSGGFPVGAVYLLIFFLIAFFVLNYTRFGRYTFAIGSNEEATRLSGVKVAKWKILVYTVCGFFAGFAGIFYAAAFTTVIPSTGNGLELQAIAGVVIGGTSLSGGVGTLAGSIIGVFIMSVLKNGLMAMQLQAQWQTFFTGLVVIGAVLLDIYRNKSANKAKKS